MPSKNTIKQYVENGYYHVYNRGVEKRNIFLDDQDYRAFLYLLKFYLSPLSTLGSNKHPLVNLTEFNPVRPRQLANLYGKVELHCFCLMPNHFHLLLKQNDLTGMPDLLRRLLTTYVMYFNRRYDRVGHLFQGTYKGVLISDESYLLHLSRYLHLNPVDMTRSHPVSYPYSSYSYYLGKKKADWLKTYLISSFFKGNKTTIVKNFGSYREFVEEYEEDSKEILGNLVLETSWQYSWQGVTLSKPCQDGSEPQFYNLQPRP